MRGLNNCTILLLGIIAVIKMVFADSYKTSPILPMLIKLYLIKFKNHGK